MRLVSFDGGFGRLEADEVVVLGKDILTFLGGRPEVDGERVALADLVLSAPVPRPPKIICIGLNYRDHAAEGDVPIPDEPPLFAQFANSLIGPGETIVVSALTSKPDYEAELAVVIGAGGADIPVGEALAAVAGYTCCNDVSARDLQFQNMQWMRGKAIDTFLPMGPWLVTADEIPDPNALGIRCSINGELLQDSNTSDMVWSVAELVAFISTTITLEPGDVIATGTPAGVGGVRVPPRFLRDGDAVTVEIDGLGALTNPVAIPADHPTLQGVSS
jgi:2,4-diketo-3-deoxy-L-fuconate hydrolase